MNQSAAVDQLHFAAYEYTTVRMKRERESLYRDAYRNFGWSVDGHEPAGPGSDKITLKLKRDRGIRNRPMVVELQRECEGALTAIADMERSVSSTAIAAALTLGVIGSALLAGSIFALDADLAILSIMLGANGLFSWIAGYFAYGRVKARRGAKLTALIERQHDVVFETGERAGELLQPASYETSASVV